MKCEKEIRERLKRLEEEPELSIDEFAADVLRWVLDDEEGWSITKLVECTKCHYRWTAVYPDGTDTNLLECPKCHNIGSQTIS